MDWGLAFYGVLGLGGLSIVIWFWFTARKSGAESEDNKTLTATNKRLAQDVKIAEQQRDVANQPAPSVDDTARWLSGGVRDDTH